jgi:hypothetical protein
MKIIPIQPEPECVIVGAQESILTARLKRLANQFLGIDSWALSTFTNSGSDFYRITAGHPTTVLFPSKGRAKNLTIFWGILL